MITLIHGPAELLRAESLAQIVAKIAPDREMADLNTTRLDGRLVAPGDLQDACDTYPFLAEHRLVLVEGLCKRLAGGGRKPVRAERSDVAPEEDASSAPPETSPKQAAAFAAYLGQVPETTELVLLEEDTAPAGVLLRRVQELAAKGQARLLLCEKPRRNELEDWIRARARFREVKLDAGAVHDLSEFVGDELRQVDQELIKLRDFAAGRTVTREDVRRLVPATRMASIFEMMDALGLREPQKAGDLMVHALDVDGEEPLRLLGMIARQYRLLIQAQTLQARGVNEREMARSLNVQDWMVPKLLRQARLHTPVQLERAMERILSTDQAIKTGRLTGREAMDVLFAELMAGTAET